MKPFKARYTEFIFLLVRLAPWVFPKWLISFASDYTNGHAFAWQKYENALNKVSLIEGDFLWKSLSVMVKIDHNDLHSIQSWLKNKAPPGEFLSNRDSDIFKNRYDKGTIYRNLGWIHFNNEQRMPSLARVNLKNKTCDSCYATVTIFPYGVIYLSLYFFLKKDVTKMISNVDISHFERYYNFMSINLFNKKFKAITHRDKRSQAEKLINDNINTVCTEVKLAAQSILSLWGTITSDKKFTLIADIYRDDDKNYFIEKEPELSVGHDDLKNTNHILIERDMNFLNEDVKPNEFDNFIVRHAVEKNELDAIFIKSKKYNEFTDFDNFARNGLTIYNSHLFIALLFDTGKQYDFISNRANPALLKNKTKLEKNFDILFDSKTGLELLTENLEAIEQNVKDYCHEEYSESATNILSYQSKRVNKLTSAIERRLHSINTQIQAQNLRFNRNYSWLVGFLIIIQIVLAALTIDWSKLL